MIVPDPLIVVEVLSPTTAHSDTSAKLIGYFKLPSVTHYLVIDPDARTVTHHERDGVPEVVAGGLLRLDPPGLAVTVEDLVGVGLIAPPAPRVRPLTCARCHLAVRLRTRQIGYCNASFSENRYRLHDENSPKLRFLYFSPDFLPTTRKIKLLQPT